MVYLEFFYKTLPRVLLAPCFSGIYWKAEGRADSNWSGDNNREQSFYKGWVKTSTEWFGRSSNTRSLGPIWQAKELLSCATRAGTNAESHSTGTACTALAAQLLWTATSCPASFVAARFTGTSFPWRWSRQEDASLHCHVGFVGFFPLGKDNFRCNKSTLCADWQLS